MNHTRALERFIKDPFDLIGYNKDLNDFESIKKLIAISILKKYSVELNIDVTTIEQNIDKYLGNSFNLQNSKLILGNNISIELTTSEVELVKLINLKKEEPKTHITPKTTPTTTPTTIPTTKPTTTPTTKPTTTPTTIPKTKTTTEVTTNNYRSNHYQTNYYSNH